MRQYIAGCAVIAALAFQGTSSAAIITVKAEAQAVDTGVSITPLVGIDTIDAGGKTFTNTYVVPGGPFVPNTRRVRAIVATRVDSISNGVDYSPIGAVGGGQIIQIAVVDGILTSQGTVLFTSGRMGYLATTGFQRNDPTTWGLTVSGDGAGGPLVDTVAGSFFAEYTLGPQDTTFYNNGDSVLFDAPEMNTSSVTVTAGTETTVGRFHFYEDGNPNFITTTPEDIVPTHPRQVNIPDMPYIEGMLVTTRDDIERNTLGDQPGLQGIETDWSDATEARNILNAIGMWGIGTVVDPLGNNSVDAGFADFGSGTAADYIPVFDATGINTSGDFRATAQVLARPTVTPVPEPSSIFALAACALPVLLRMRRRKAVVAC